MKSPGSNNKAGLKTALSAGEGPAGASRFSPVHRGSLFEPGASSPRLAGSRHHVRKSAARVQSPAMWDMIRFAYEG
jgi:hypothetical protein